MTQRLNDLKISIYNNSKQLLRSKRIVLKKNTPPEMYGVFYKRRVSKMINR
jgi:hypothetical protein